MFCKHQWKIISETTTKSKIEHAYSIGKIKLKSGNSYDLERKFIQILTCQECGRLKRFVEKI